MEKYKAILYLDDSSKALIKTSISSFTSRGILFISSFTEITESVLVETNKVLLLEGYFNRANSFPELKLFKSLMNLDCYFLGSNQELSCILEETLKCYQCDITTLTYEVVQAALFEDKSLESKSKISAENTVTLAKRLLRENRIEDPDFQVVANAFISLQDFYNDKRKEAFSLQEKATLLENENASLRQRSLLLEKGYNQLITGAADFNKRLRQFEIVFSQDIYQKINLHNYSERPLIIYLKEYEELSNFETLLETLFSVFQIQEKKSVKVLRLYDSSSCRKLLTLPEYYTIMANRYHEKDVLANDYLCKSGDYTTVLELLLLNKINLDVLIVVDCKDQNDVVYSGTILQLNMCRTPAHLGKLGLFSENTIVNADIKDHPELLCWGNYRVSDMSREEKFIFLSARPVIQKILELSRVFEQEL